MGPKTMQAVSLILAFILYRANPAPTLPLAAFLIGLLWVPLFAVIILISPAWATLVREPNGSDRIWSPIGLELSNSVIRTLFLFWAMRDLDVAADTHKDLAADFEIFLAAEDDFSFFYAVGVSLVACMAFECAKKVSLRFGPLLERFRIVRWDVEVLEQAEIAE